MGLWRAWSCPSEWQHILRHCREWQLSQTLITFEAESCRRGLEQAVLGRFRWDIEYQQKYLPARFWASLL